MIEFECPHCDQRISAEPQWAGKDSECPSCSGYLVIPFLSSVDENESQPASQSGPRKSPPLLPESNESIPEEFYLAWKVRSLHRRFGRMPPKVRIPVIGSVTLVLCLFVIALLGRKDKILIRADLEREARERKPFSLLGDDFHHETVEVKCPRCEGTGKDLLLSGCSRCRGAGNLTTPSGLYYLCPVCEGTGRYHATCTSCEGSGKIKISK